MSKEDEYVARVRSLDVSGLLGLWHEIDAGTDGWPPGKAFEYLVPRAFEVDGANVRYPYAVATEGMILEQIDGAVYASGLSCLIESKHQDQPISFGPIAKLRTKLDRRPPGIIGIVFSYKGFTEPARLELQRLAPLTILLWEGEEIPLALTRCGMVQALKLKHRYAVERGLPDYNLRIGGSP